MISTIGNHFGDSNKVLDTTSNQMLISNIWIFRTNDGSNNQILEYNIKVLTIEMTGRKPWCIMYKSTDHGSDVNILFHAGFLCVIF